MACSYGGDVLVIELLLIYVYFLLQKLFHDKSSKG